MFASLPHRGGTMSAMRQAKAKLRVTMSPALVRKLKALVVKGRAESVSALVERAVEAQLAAEARFDELLTEALMRTGGPPTAAERARARKRLRGTA